MERRPAWVRGTSTQGVAATSRKVVGAQVGSTTRTSAQKKTSSPRRSSRSAITRARIMNLDPEEEALQLLKAFGSSLLIEPTAADACPTTSCNGDVNPLPLPPQPRASATVPTGGVNGVAQPKATTPRTISPPQSHIQPGVGRDTRLAPPPPPESPDHRAGGAFWFNELSAEGSKPPDDGDCLYSTTNKQGDMVHVVRPEVEYKGLFSSMDETLRRNMEMLRVINDYSLQRLKLLYPNGRLHAQVCLPRSSVHDGDPLQHQQESRHKYE